MRELLGRVDVSTTLNIYAIMLINFNEISERRAPGMNGGTGEMSAKMYMDKQGKIIPCRIHPGGVTEWPLNSNRVVK